MLTQTGYWQTRKEVRSLYSAIADDFMLKLKWKGVRLQLLIVMKL